MQTMTYNVQKHHLHHVVACGIYSPFVKPAQIHVYEYQRKQHQMQPAPVKTLQAGIQERA